MTMELRHSGQGLTTVSTRFTNLKSNQQDINFSRVRNKSIPGPYTKKTSVSSYDPPVLLVSFFSLGGSKQIGDPDTDAKKNLKKQEKIPETKTCPIVRKPDFGSGYGKSKTLISFTLGKHLAVQLK